MNKFIIAAASAVLLASTAGIASAQEAQGTAETEILKKKPGANSATEAAPRQQQKAGEVDSASDAAPGQQMKTGEIESATEAAPGLLMQEDQAQGEQQQQDNKSASEFAPGQQQSGEVDSASEAAPGQQLKSGEADSAAEAAPGQIKKQDQATGETDQPSSETTASIDISTEQRTEITQVFRTEKADPVNVDFDINVGVVIPRTVVLHPLPPRVIEIVPAYRSYQYFVLADGRIIIVEPNTLRIVYVLVV